MVQNLSKPTASNKKIGIGSLYISSKIPQTKRWLDDAKVLTSPLKTRGSPAMARNPDDKLIQHLTRSSIFQDYERAFNDATDLPLALRPVEVWNSTLRGKKNENPFCALLAQSSKSCAACLEVQHEITQNEDGEAKTVTCFAGLSDTAVPVHLGTKVIGYLQTGQVALKDLNQAQFQRITAKLLQWGSTVDLSKLEEAYFQSRVLTTQQYTAMVRLLEIFAQHLSTISNQIAVQDANAEPPIIHRAKEYIEEHKSDPISLGEVAKTLNVSTFYFCKLFKKATGLNFTDYLSRVRIEKAKNLLLNPNLRVSEIAYEVGFQSLTHFNRVFLRIVGCSPTSYRDSLPA